METIARFTGVPPLITSKEVPYMAQHLWYDTSKAKTQLGLEPAPIEDSIRRSLDWFRREGYLEAR
jgi:dihydroflavonol-4-reductase